MKNLTNISLSSAKYDIYSAANRLKNYEFYISLQEITYCPYDRCLRQATKIQSKYVCAVNQISKVWLSVTEKTIFHSYHDLKLSVMSVKEKDEEDILLSK